ncbi:MAG: fibronectin type III domain-containing protein [Smithella sp.]|nr:fibronectin type III domain-containing protein [Smithella sp.]
MKKRIVIIITLFSSIQLSSCITDDMPNYFEKRLISLINMNYDDILAAPLAPSNLHASAISPSQINLVWEDNASNETGFILERRADSEPDFTPIVSSLPAGTTSYGNTDLDADTTYHYRVVAFNDYGNSFSSNEASATTSDIIPFAPSGLVATKASSSQINLTWTDNSDNENGYKIERRADGETEFTEIESGLPAGSTSYNNTGLTPDTAYYYQVRAFNGVGDSGYSNISSATTDDVAPSSPTGLMATAVSNSRINLSWSDNSNNESGFVIQRSPDNSVFSQIATVSSNISSYANTGLDASTLYYYRVLAYNGIGNSGYSNTASATTLAAPAGVNTDPPASTVKYVFIHHSTGSYWIQNGYGNLGTALNANNYYITECDYGWDAEPSDNLGNSTDTVHWPLWFNDTKMPYVYGNSSHYDYTNTISDPGGQNEIIMFKSCYPNSEVGSSIDDEKAIYNGLLPYFGAHTDKMFVLIVPPPKQSLSTPLLTRELANWLVDETTGWLSIYNTVHNNVYVFDYYNVLTHPDNHHWVNDGAVEHVVANSSNVLYYPSGDDHPSAEGQQKATEEFMPLLNVFYNKWKGN